MSKLLPKTLSVFAAIIVVVSPLLHTVNAATFSGSLASGTFTSTQYNSGTNSISLTSQDIQTTETKALSGGNVKLLATYEDPKLLGIDRSESILYIGLENEIVVLDTKKTVSFADDAVLGTYSSSTLSGFPAGPYNELTVSSFDNIFIDTTKDVVIIKKSVIGRNGTDTTSDDVYYGELGTTGWYRNIVRIGQDYLVTTNDTGIKLIQTHGTPTTSDDTILDQYSDCAGGKFCVPTSQPMGKVFYDDVADIVYVWGYNPNIPGSTLNAVARNGTTTTDDDTVAKAYYGPASLYDAGIVDFDDSIIFSGSDYADGQTLLFDTKGNHNPSDDTYTGFYHSSTVPGVESTTSNRMVVAYSSSQNKFVFTGASNNQLFGVVSTEGTPTIADDTLSFSIKSSDIASLLGVDDKNASFWHTDNSYELFYDENTSLIYATLGYSYTENEQVEQGKALFIINISENVDDTTLLLPRNLSVTNLWQEKTALDIGRISPAFGVINSKLYVAGGTKDWTDQETLEIYDYNTDQWSYGESMPESRVSAGSIAIGDKLYVIGGRNSSYTYLSSAYVYDSTSNTWAALTSMPTARVSPAVAHVNGKIYVMGGTINGNDTVATVEVYDIATNSWSTVNDMPHTRSNGHASAVFDSKIYVTGGTEFGSDPYDDSLFVYDIDSDTWTTGTNMPKQVAGTASVVYNNKWYVIGGTNNDGDSINNVFEYDFLENTWAEVVSLPTSRHRVAAGVVNDGLLIAGGRDYDWDTSDKTYWLPFENIRDNLSHFYFKSLSWVASTPVGTSVEMKYTLNGGQSYLSAPTSGAILPQNTTSQFAYKPRFLSTDPAVAASISSVTATYVRYSKQGEYVSAVFGGGQVDSFTELQTTQTTPAGTGISYYVRTGNTAVVDGSWSDWVVSTTLPVTGKKYAQIKAVLTTSDLGSTPQLESLNLQYTEKTNVTPTNAPSQNTAEEETTNIEENTEEEEKLVLNNYQEYLLGTGKIFELKQKQTIYFLVENKGSFQEHSATVTEVGEDYVQLTIASTPVLVRINVGEQKLHDVDEDGSPDIAIKLNGITNGLANLTFAQVLTPSVTPTAIVTTVVPTESRADDVRKSINWMLLILVIGGAVAILIISLRRRK